MRVKLDHLIVPAKDKAESAAFLTSVLGLEAASRNGPFLAVSVDNEVTLDFMDVDCEIPSQHYAFMVDNERFQQILDRMVELKREYWADPFHHEANEIGDFGGSRHVYFLDPSGHNMEVLTA